MPFRQLARWYQATLPASPQPSPRQLGEAAARVFALHPMQVGRYLEEFWGGRVSFGAIPRDGSAQQLPREIYLTGLRSGIEGDLSAVTDDIFPLCDYQYSYPYGGTVDGDSDCGGLRAPWDHLIYAYFVENTRIYEIFARVLREYLHGERLETPSEATQQWLRTTEDLFYRDTPPLQIFSLTSWIRPDMRATRRNAYYRMFAMDLNHGTADNRPYPYEKPQAANRDFVGTIEEWYREIWRGVENFANISGPNSTDDAAIAYLAQRLHDMLTMRREHGNLAREEFFAVATMSWLHLAIEFDSPIVRDLKAEAASAEDRLRGIGERVGVAAHGKSANYLRLATRLSPILRQVEDGVFNDPGDVPVLYADPGPIRRDVTAIVTHWSLATGRDMKARKVVSSPRAADGAVGARNGSPQDRRSLVGATVAG